MAVGPACEHGGRGPAECDPGAYPVTTTLALVVTLVVLAAVNLWVHVGPSRWQPVTGPLLAAGLLLLGRWAGLSWPQLGLGRGTLVPGLVWGGAAVTLVIAGYAVGLAVPAWRGLFLDARHAVGPLRAARRAFVVVPLGVVVFEEVAFRGVLWGLVGVEHGTLWAAVVTSVLFGLWHVLPALHVGSANRGVSGAIGGHPWVVVTATVAFTALGGLVFGELRRRSGSVLAAMGAHWATNALGVLFGLLAWRLAG